MCIYARPRRCQETWRPKKTPVPSKTLCSVQGSRLMQEKATPAASNPLQREAWPSEHAKGGALGLGHP